MGVKFICEIFLFIIHTDCVHDLSSFCLHHNVAAIERLNPDTGKLGMSYSKFKRKDLSELGHLILTVKLMRLYILYFADLISFNTLLGAFNWS